MAGLGMGGELGEVYIFDFALTFIFLCPIEVVALRL